ncbi:hypothetical protein HYC85_001469 [Camellia sinensis]|uniref:CCHC-type domain-containing protein n=1 Tax=Camellia sinensis TaxID=4442 RepID=A0A7J7I5I3_CAMSI|nr:hypothetical protein HYC85_001469 [Camellia sinensis]
MFSSGEVKKWVWDSREMLSMLMVQVFATGLQLLSRVILIEGTFIFALMSYRHVVGAICVVPFAFFCERGKEKKLTWKIAFWLFMNALTGFAKVNPHSKFVDKGASSSQAPRSNGASGNQHTPQGGTFKCFRCGEPGHRSSGCRKNMGNNRNKALLIEEVEEHGDFKDAPIFDLFG